MTSSRPVIKQISWISMVPQLILMGILIIIFQFFTTTDPFLYAVLVYLALSVGLKQFIPYYHRKGVRFYKKGEYEKAIVQFQASYDFFVRHQWIDKYRSVLLLSASRISYTEMALVNLAFCHSQLGNGSMSKELYEKVLSEFPDSQMAKTSLKMFDATKDIK